MKINTLFVFFDKDLRLDSNSLHKGRNRIRRASNASQFEDSHSQTSNRCGMSFIKDTVHEILSWLKIRYICIDRKEHLGLVFGNGEFQRHFGIRYAHRVPVLLLSVHQSKGLPVAIRSYASWQFTRYDWTFFVDVFTLNNGISSLYFNPNSGHYS